MYRFVKEPEKGPGWRREVFAVPISDAKFDCGRPFKNTDGLQSAVLKLIIHRIPFDKASAIILLHKLIKKNKDC